jgi:beta-xylosidase
VSLLRSFLLVLLVPLCGFALQQTYTNPIIPADYSDPDVIRVGEYFYLTASSFNVIPGLPILHSRDLVNWKIIGHALPQQPPAGVFARPQHGNGVWAPAIRFRKGYFYIFYGDPDFGIYMVKARNAAGPCPFWDDDGNAYLVHAWADSRSGIKSILTINRMSADGTQLLDVLGLAKVRFVTSALVGMARTLSQ